MSLLDNLTVVYRGSLPGVAAAATIIGIIKHRQFQHTHAAKGLED